MFLGFVAAIVMMGTCATIRATKEEAVIRVETRRGADWGIIGNSRKDAARFFASDWEREERR